jgi:4-amino-4-deoxy-L-arabinose transferase-like glycosyltransferase
MNIPATRISSILIGTLAIASVFLMMNELAGRRMAWLTATLMTTYHYHVHWSRIALSNIWVTLLIPLTLGLFLLGWRKNNDKGAILAGLTLGLSAYIYSGGYFIIFLLIFLFIQTWRKTDNPHGLIKYTTKMLALALVVAMPLIIFAILVPEHFFDRAYIVRGWTDKAIQSISQGEIVTPWDYFQHQVKYSFGAYNFYPEVTGFYRPDAPFLIGFASILFLVGIPIALRQKQYLLIFWIFIVTVLGGVMLDGTPASTHFIGVIPAVCWMVAIPLDKLFEKNQMNWAYTLLALTLFTDLFFYFFIYASSPSLDLDAPFPIIMP